MNNFLNIMPFLHVGSKRTWRAYCAKRRESCLYHSRNSGLAVTIAIAFVVCWASGYLAARFTRDLFTPFNLLLFRYAVTAMVLAVIVIWTERSQTIAATRQAMTIPQLCLGILYHVVYIGCVFYAVKMGLSAGIVAVILATQPLVTLLLECILARSRPTYTVFGGAAICIFGSVLLADMGDISAAALPLAIAIFGMLAIAVATLIHARFVHDTSLWPSLFVQFSVATIATAGLLLLGAEPFMFQFTPVSIMIVLFLVFITTLGSYISMNWLIARIDTKIYALLFYLVPPLVLLLDWIMFQSPVSIWQGVGGIFALVGVYISINGLPFLSKRDISV